ncbi:DMT family transporter [Streptomyces siamensis]|uniref:hypothetical protein n=1 Tax=Streptomyces siamensis TaxID=1274986 RepID=UPI003CD0B1BB
MTLLGRGGLDGIDLAGAGCALGAGATWAAYIRLSARTGSRFPQADGLAPAMAGGALLSPPAGPAEQGDALFHPLTLALGAAVALLSSVLPSTLELLALWRLRSSTFTVLMSLAPRSRRSRATSSWARASARPNTGPSPVARRPSPVVVAGAGAVRASAHGPHAPLAD